MNTQKPYSALVSQAELAVSAVKDPELRRVAFEKVLDDLLLNAADGPARSAPSPAIAHADAPPIVKHKTSPNPKAKQSGPQSYIEELVEEAFFGKPKTIAEVKGELENRGHHIPLTSLSGPLQKLCQKKVLRRQKADGKGSKKSFGYSNW